MPSSAPLAPNYFLPYIASQSPATDTASTFFLDAQFDDQQEPSSAGPSRRRKRDDKHIRRPANPFILFASDYRKKKENRNRDNRELSREAGVLWRLMPEPQKNEWMERANEVKEKHAEQYPEYRYQPRRREVVRLPSCSDVPQDDSSVFFFPPISPPSQKSSTGSKRSPRKKAAVNANHSAKSSADRPPLPQQFEHETQRHATEPAGTTSAYEDDYGDDFVESLRRSLFETTSVAGHYSGTSQQPADSPGDGSSHLCLPQLTSDPEQVPAPRIDFGSRFPANSTTYTLFGQQFGSETRNKNKMDPQSSTSEVETAPFFNIFGLPIQVDQCDTPTSSFDPGFNSFFNDSGSPYRR
ncbi:hypothetical protein A7U60_g6557 [Sanghuangporus baumii]|uniref:HMG box domain-containing protein n=1 Tax=Sanghuangporus baumii TaxID=108892 RepID=A0A9Q5HV06_SANBA|nr:hypothetical protein A7U60_g6557 [Sanghuangporus baumii]